MTANRPPSAGCRYCAGIELSSDELIYAERLRGPGL